MQLGTGVGGAGETTTAEDGGLHAEVGAILLDHDVGGDFAGSKDGVLAHVDGHILVDTDLVSVGRIDFPAEFLLDEGKLVGAVAVDLIGGSKDEDRFGSMEAGGL